MIISMKTPDCVEYAINDYVMQEKYDENDNIIELTEEEKEEREELRAELAERLEKWFKYGECLTLKYDIEKDELIIRKGN